MGIIAGLIVRNEANRYLEQVLKQISAWADDIVVVDDCSIDNTIEICRAFTKRVYRMDKPTFVENETTIRKYLYDKLSETKDEWHAIIDADEMLENKFAVEIKNIISNPKIHWIGLKFFDFWLQKGNDFFYRADGFWSPKNRWGKRLYRYHPEYNHMKWPDKKMASFCIPPYVFSLPGINTEFRLKHLGYLRDEDKKAKYMRYKSIDQGKYHNINHIESILDKNPVLEKWAE